MAQAKRSPILGYNHNVKYRGVVFHVQTEDSGMLNPHLFTHLFHEGVIVSTRKLVYDAGSNEESIKSLMQAQHKAVMKDLKKGTFDEKIDQYLAGTPGLEPREGGSAVPLPRGERAKTEHTPEEPPPVESASKTIDVPIGAAPTIDISNAAPTLEISNSDLSEPIELPIKGSRADTGDQTRPISIEPPMPSDALDAPTLSDNASMIAAIQAANSQSQPAPPPEPPPAKARTSTAQKVSRSSVGATPPTGTPRPHQVGQVSRDSYPAIEIVDDNEVSGRHRVPRDTAVESIPDHVGDVQHTTPTRAGTPASHGAAALPPSRPSMSPPVVTRPATGERKRPGDSEVVEIYQPAPPSVDPPPGERGDRAGTYSVTRKSSDAPIREKTGRIAAISPDPAKAAPIPAGLGRPGQARPNSGAVPQPMGSRDSGPNRVPPNVQREPTPSTRAATPPPVPAAARGGTPAPVRPGVTAPIANRASTPSANSGVVMTRPAVIVGAPPKPPQQPAPQRVRKAREDEGRGFGQGLISEKSLDEVILAYLSEDAEDK